MSPLSVTDLSRRAWMQRSLWAGAGLASAALAGEAARAQPVPGGPVRAAAPAWLAATGSIRSIFCWPAWR